MKGSLNAVKRAGDAYQKAAEALVQATMETFPAGTLVAVTMHGRMTRLRGRVLSAGGYWWSRPDEVRIVNLATGKKRKFQATCKYVNVEILEVAP